MAQRGVCLEDIAHLVLELQKGYYSDLTFAECLESVMRVLDKREVQNAILTGLTLDILTERGLVDEPLASILRNDDNLYGIDEILSLSIVNSMVQSVSPILAILIAQTRIIGSINGKNNRVNTP